ncbi:MAG: alpha/beta fold hydrolase [Chitinophagales bacterium]
MKCGIYLLAFFVVMLNLCSCPGCALACSSNGGSDSTGYFPSFDGIKIYFEVHGQGYPVLLVHGFTSTGDSWKKGALYDDLLTRKFKVITVDLRGNGKSDKPHADTAYANDAEAKDLMGLLTALGITKYFVVGYSRGSIITARLLVLDHRIDKAVMGGIGLDFSNPDWPRRVNFYKALRGDSIPELTAMVKRVQAEGLDQQALAMQQKDQPSTSKQQLAAIQEPVLVICGSEDADNGSAAELAKILPHAELQTVPGDHGSTSRTAAFAQKVIEFLIK